jgi:hypothetical protein
MFLRRKIRPTRDGRFAIDLEPWERDVLRTLPGQLRELLATDDPALERLFPPAYLADEERNEEYRRLMRGDLTSSRLSSLEVLEATIDATTLDEDELVAWMGSLNDLRLVLGTRLDVSEDMDDEPFEEDDPRAAAFALYRYLAHLQEWVVAALSSRL